MTHSGDAVKQVIQSRARKTGNEFPVVVCNEGDLTHAKLATLLHALFQRKD